MTCEVVVLGSAVMDVIGYAPRRPGPGETVVGDRYRIAPGGKGLNQAVAAARAGARAAFVGCLGDDDFGDGLMKTLVAEGVKVEAVFVRPGQQTGVGMPIMCEGADNSIVVVPGASGDIGEDQRSWMRQNIGPDSVFVSQLELPLEVVESSISLAADRGARIVFNPAPADGAESLLAKADVLVPNQAEAEQLTGHADPRRAARDLASYRDGLEVVVTCGADGILVLSGSEEISVGAPAVEPVDTVGAGDVFCGYLAAGLAAGVSVLEAAGEAVHAAALSVTRPGAAMSAPLRDEFGNVGQNDGSDRTRGQVEV